MVSQIKKLVYQFETASNQEVFQKNIIKTKTCKDVPLIALDDNASFFKLLSVI